MAMELERAFAAFSRTLPHIISADYRCYLFDGANKYTIVKAFGFRVQRHRLKKIIRRTP